MLKYSICASYGAALHEPVLYRKDYNHVFAYAKELGYDGVEIHLRDAGDVNAEVLRQESEKSGVKVAAIATGLAQRIDGLSLIDNVGQKRQEAIARIRGHLDLASQFGCPVIIGSMRANIPHPEKREECLERLADSLQMLAGYIENKNCTIVLEAINRYENNYLNTAEETACFIDKINSQKVKMLLDTFHMNIEECNMLKAIQDYHNYVGHIHFADNTRWYPGHGQIDFFAILNVLENVRYKGWISMEYLPLPNELEAGKAGAVFIQQAKQYYK